MCVFLGTVERGKAPGRCLESESVEPQSSVGTGVSTAEIIKRLLSFMGGEMIKCHSVILIWSHRIWRVNGLQSNTHSHQPPFAKNEPSTDQVAGAEFVCMATVTAEVSLLPRWRMQQTTTTGTVTRVTRCVMNVATPQTHTQNTWFGCHGARNVCFFFVCFLHPRSGLAKYEEKDKMYFEPGV